MQKKLFAFTYILLVTVPPFFLVQLSDDSVEVKQKKKKRQKRTSHDVVREPIGVWLTNFVGGERNVMLAFRGRNSYEYYSVCSIEILDNSYPERVLVTFFPRLIRVSHFLHGDTPSSMNLPGPTNLKNR